MNDKEVWDRVATAIRDRMDELGWDQIELVRRSGLSDSTVRKLMYGRSRRYHRSTLMKASGALGWSTDAIWQILLRHAHNTATEPQPDVLPPRRVDETLRLVKDIKIRVNALERHILQERSQ